jgi:peptide/nickel transport system substrate-binding protein
MSRWMPGVHGIVCVCAAAFVAACVVRPAGPRDAIVVGMSSGPNSLDPRFGLDDPSQKLHQLMFDGLLTIGDDLRATTEGGLAEKLDNPDATTYVATLRRGVRFHDGHELTATDVLHTFHTILDPQTGSPHRGAYRGLRVVEARDRYTVVFRLDEPFSSFPINLVIPQIVPAGAGPDFPDRPIGTGPYRFVRHVVDDRIELVRFDDYWQGPARNEGLVLRVVPDEVMRGLELRKGTMDVVVNDVSPDILHQLRRDQRLQTSTAPGVDYQYIGLNLRDPVLRDARVRQALAHAIDRQGIVEHLRRGLATAASGLIPPIAWAHEPGVMSYDYDPARARSLLDEAGYPDADGPGPLTRLRLTLKTSNLEFNRLQASVVQQDLARIGVALDVRMYEFATLFADVVAGNFQLYFLQWAGGSLADPDILRRVFHSSQRPPTGFNRGHYRNPDVDALLDEAATTLDDGRRQQAFARAQRILSADLPYISLWHKTNFAIAQRSLTGVRLSPIADFHFLRHVARTSPVAAR